MVKAHFPLYQADDRSIRMIVAAMDQHIEGTKYFGEVVHFWSAIPQLYIVEKGVWPDGRMKYDCNWTIHFPSVEKYEEAYRLVRAVFEPQGYVWAVSKGTSPLLREDILALTEKNYWYSEETDSYFYCEFTEKSFSEEIQAQFAICRAHDKWYMMSDSYNISVCGDRSQEEVRKLCLNNDIVNAYAMYLAGDPLFKVTQMSGNANKFCATSRKEAYELLGIYPQPAPVLEETQEEFIPWNIRPSVGFPPHPKKVGWMQGDYNIDPMYSNAYMWSEEEYKASLNN